MKNSLLAIFYSIIPHYIIIIERNIITNIQELLGLFFKMDIIQEVLIKISSSQKLRINSKTPLLAMRALSIL